MAYQRVTNDSVAATVQTTGATPTTAATLAMENNGNCTLRANVVARTSAGQVKMWTLRGAGERHNGGNAALVGCIDTELEKSDTEHCPWSATIKASGTDFIVEVKGESGVTIDWSAHLIAPFKHYDA